MARVDVVCEIEADGSVKIEVEASDRAVCAAEAAALREKLTGKPSFTTSVRPALAAVRRAEELDVSSRRDR